MRPIRTLAVAAVIAAAVPAAAAATAPDHAPPAGPVTIEDITIPVPGQQPLTAYLVRPTRHGSLAGVLYLHWFEPPASTQNRTEFLAEAVTIAGRGAVAVLPDLRFPWQGTVHGDARDVAAVRAQADAVTSAYRALLAQPGVDRRRTAVVGHDYGAMYGALLTQRERGIAAEVFLAGDATWSNWFATFFGVEVPDLPAYDALFAGLDPVSTVSRPGVARYFQWAGGDGFIPQSTRDRFAAADPAATVSLYPRADHFLDQHAKDDRIPWLAARLGLSATH